MPETVYEKIDKFSQDLVVGDEFRVGEILVCILKKEQNKHDELVLHLDVLGATIKKRSKMMLIIPKKLPIETLK